MTINECELEGIWKEAILDHWKYYRKIFCSSGGKVGNSAWYELTPTIHKSEVLPLEITC